MKQERSADRRKHHIIYKTTCLVTGRYYIGMHSTDDLADGYIGSGKRLWQSIRKHGAAQHHCEVLEQLPSREALALREAELVNEQLLEDKLCMNLTLGGHGSWEAANRVYTPEARKRLGVLGADALRKACQENKHHCQRKTPLSLAERQQLAARAKFPQHAAKLGAAAAAKMLPAFWKRFYSAGGKSALQDKRWVCNEQGAKLIEIDELQSHLAQGYVRGKTFKQPSPKKALFEQRMADYQRLQPTCRNAMCAKPLSYQQHSSGMTSCSKACSNKTRVSPHRI